MRRLTRVALIVATVTALASPAPVAVAAPPVEPTTVIRVMALNIFYGGDELDLHTGSFCHRPAGCAETLAQVEHVIEASNADIVGIEEGEHNAGVIAAALGWHASDRLQVISRFPIVDPPGGEGVAVWVEVLP